MSTEKRNRDLPAIADVNKTLENGVGTKESQTAFFPNQGSAGGYRMRPLRASIGKQLTGSVMYLIKVKVIESTNPVIDVGSTWTVAFVPTSAKNLSMKQQQWLRFCAAITKTEHVKTEAEVREIQEAVLDLSDNEDFGPAVDAFDVRVRVADGKEADDGTVYSNIVQVDPWE